MMMMFGFGWLLILLVVALPVVLILFLLGRSDILNQWQRTAVTDSQAQPSSRPAVMSDSRQTPAPNRYCSHCGAGLQADWIHCPQCGAPIQ